MENKIETYKKQFKPETLELIVRISWCRDKSCCDFKSDNNYYIAQARFDKALNAKTGESLGTGFGFNWLEWLVPKNAPQKRFGFKYGYKFKKGHTYRILVREYIPGGNDKFKKYYLERILEKDVNEPRLDEAYTFESNYEEAISDLTVLIKKRISGWPIVSNYRIPRAAFLASINNQTNVLSSSHGTLTWIEKDSGAKIKFNFNAMCAYRIRARKSKEDNNTYLLLDVIKKVTDDRFEHIKEQYLTPVVIKNELGEFSLNRDYNQFEGKTNYLSEECLVNMNIEEGETTTDIQLNKLREIYRDLPGWDSQVREYAAGELLALANEWCEDEVEITKAQFIQRIDVPMLIIDTDGSVAVMFESDNMFTDHAIVINIDANGNFIEAKIEG